jgi:hypothetical protein
MHLYGETLQRYLRDDLPQDQRADIDIHVANCLPCAHAIAGDGTTSGRWERRGFLGRLVRVDAPTDVPARPAQPQRIAA